MKFVVVLCALSFLALAQECKDDADGLVAENGVTCEILSGMGCEVDLATLQPSLPTGTFTKIVCPVTCDNCDGVPVAAPAATRDNAAASDDASDEEADSDGCKDDADGLVAENGVTCEILSGMGCEVDLATLQPSLPQDTFTKIVCPKTCDNCPVPAASLVVSPVAAPVAAPAAAPAAASDCKDDPTGDVANAGVSCAILKGMGCDVDLSTLSPDLAKDTFVKLVCPLACDACPAAAPTDDDPVPDATPDDAASDAPAAPAAAPASDTAAAPAPAAAPAVESVGPADGMMCCMAMTASCLSCSAGQSVEDYCKGNPDTVGCEEIEDEDTSLSPAPASAPASAPAPAPALTVACCTAMTASCLSCSAGLISLEDYCKGNPDTVGCEEIEDEECPKCEQKECPLPRQTKYLVRNNKNQNMCLTAGAMGKRIALKKCNSKSAAQHWAIEDGTLQNAVGCVNSKMLMAECGSKGLVSLKQQSGAGHHIMLGNRCLNMKGPKLNNLKCNKQVKTQGWVVQVQL